MTWRWTKSCRDAFKSTKEKIVSPNVLVHYDVARPLRLAADASAYGIGAVISHVMDDGSERPIAFASRMLMPSERNYAQVEKEALSLVFGVCKFHSYLYGRKFTLITDHKPLTSILGPKKGVPPIAAARLQRWGIRVVVPEKCRKKLLLELHRDHPGICKMKSIARSYMWWPGNIEDLAKSCLDCQAVKKAPPVAPLQPWEWPSRVLQRVHVDFAGARCFS